MKNKIVQIIPVLRLKRNLHYFDYLLPEKLISQAKIGQLVEIPFRNKVIKGIILNLSSKTASGNYALKQVIKIIDPLPFLANWQLELIKYLADYYFVSRATVVKMLIPAIPKRVKESNKKITKVSEFLIAPKSKVEIEKYYQAEKPVLLQYFKYEDKIKVYLALIKKVLKQKKQILIVMPLLSDVKRIYQFLAEYKDITSVFLNNLPKNRYWQEWLKIKKGQVKIIIGTRSAIFAPFKDLDLIIIDDEDNENHKQEEPNPRYNSKDVALKFKELLKTKVIFTALTPSLNSFYKTEIKEWQYFAIGQLENVPQIKIIDKKEEFKKNNYGTLSEELIKDIGENLKRSKKVFLFLNRKGLATLISCRDCGYLAVCPTCKLPLTYHINKSLFCHYCGHKEDLFLFCPKCKGPNIKMTGTGTEKVEIEMKKQFPQSRVLKIDLETPLAEKEIDNYDIIIGTQFAFDLIDWRRINLIGVINADTSFYLPDYKSMEKTFNLLTKLALFLSSDKKSAKGLAAVKTGGSPPEADKTASGGELLIQTFSPDNYVFTAFKNFDQVDFYKNELAERKILNYPPCAKLIKLIFQGFEYNAGQKEIETIYKNLISKIKGDKGVIINAPLLAYTQQVRGRFRWQIVIKILDSKTELNFLEDLPEDVIIDIDPESLL